MVDDTPEPAPVVSTELGRREFLRRMVLVAAAGLAAVACGPQRAPVAATSAPAPTSAPPVVAATSQAAQAPKPAATTAAAAPPATTPTRGGILTWAQWDINDSLEPANASGASALEIIGALTDRSSPSIAIRRSSQRWRRSGASRTTRSDTRSHCATT